jgi:hypothetical protein
MYTVRTLADEPKTVGKIVAVIPGDCFNTLYWVEGAIII